MGNCIGNSSTDDLFEIDNGVHASSSLFSSPLKTVHFSVTLYFCIFGLKLGPNQLYQSMASNSEAMGIKNPMRVKQTNEDTNARLSSYLRTTKVFSYYHIL